MEIRMTQHAIAQAQQRGIPKAIIGNLYRFGETRNSNGATSIFLIRKALRSAENELPAQEFQTLTKYRNSFLIVGDEQQIITAARSLKKFYRQ
ncbi:hypothetical protein GOA99_18620 [Sinorhizobium meliloti]|nr:hypothetical protein [Sinorhizobium meliloti]